MGVGIKLLDLVQNIFITIDLFLLEIYFEMVGFLMVVQAHGSLLANITDLFQGFLCVHLGSVQFEVKRTVGPVIAHIANYVFNLHMHDLDVSSHMVGVRKNFIT